MFVIKYLFKHTFHAINSKNARVLLKLMTYYGNKKRYVKTNVRFLGWNFIVPDTMSFLFQFKEIFVDEYYKFSTKTESPIIIDCGSNIGCSLAYFSSNYPKAKIIAFEADPAIFYILEKNINNNKFKNIVLHQSAVWVDDQGISLASEGADGGSMFGNGLKNRVPSIRLKDELEKYSTIDMLKIDIEGAENEVILDCRNSLNVVQNIFLEYHTYANEPQKLGEILNIFTKAGFKYYINNETAKTSPLVNMEVKNNMALQLNIFAYRSN